MQKSPRPDDEAVLGRLSTLDRFLPLWIGLAMAGGLLLGSVVSSLNDQLDRLRVGTVSLPIAIGLLADDVSGAGEGALRGDR